MASHATLGVCGQELIVFKGIYAVFVNRKMPCHGWTGSRGDICRALQREYQQRAPDASRALRLDTAVTEVDVGKGRLVRSKDGKSETLEFDLVVGADGGGSVVRNAMIDQLPSFSVTSSALPK